MPRKGTYCVMKNCHNYSSCYDGSFFRFPDEEKEPVRYKLWCEASGCDTEELEKRRRNHVCADHFEDSMFANVFIKNRLSKNAVPSSYDVIVNKLYKTNYLIDGNEALINFSDSHSVKRSENTPLSTPKKLFLERRLSLTPKSCNSDKRADDRLPLTPKNSNNSEPADELLKTKSDIVKKCTLNEFYSLCNKFLTPKMAEFTKSQASSFAQKANEIINEKKQKESLSKLKFLLKENKITNEI